MSTAIVDPLPAGVTPEQVLLALPRGNGLFFLDSATPSGGLGRWSWIGYDPHAMLATSAADPSGADPLDTLDAIMERARVARGMPDQHPSGPFRGGAVGFFSYDLGRRFERIPSLAADDLGIPDLRFGLYDLFCAFDSLNGRGWIISTGDPELGSRARTRARERLVQMRDTLRGLLDGERGRAVPRRPSFFCDPPLPDHTRESYCASVRRCLEWIAAGHIYQVNLSRRFVASFSGDPAGLYLSLRAANPAPFAAYLDLGDRQILSSSPERFFSISGRTIEARPIKGTRPRGADPVQDARLAQELLASEKDRAELTMIVDLLRNDLGRVCTFGSVHVSSLRHLESYQTVHHLVGVVRGHLRPEVSACAAIRRSFPGGSITGAPKIRAMEIIEEMEPFRRGIYCGAIGYIGFDGNADFNIAIRTCLVQNGKLYIYSGGGIVADSDPDAEYDETLCKAEGILRALTEHDRIGVSLPAGSRKR